MSKRKKKTDKSLSIGIKLLLILLLACSLVGVSVCAGYAVKYVNSSKVKINCDGRQYEYKYSTLVGMKEKQVNDTPAVLIFVPDDVLIFPDEIFDQIQG